MIDNNNLEIYFEEVSPERLEGYWGIYYTQGGRFAYEDKTDVRRKCFAVDREGHIFFYVDNPSVRGVYRFVREGVEHGLLSDLLPDVDLDNLKPHEVGLIKLKYGLTQEDIRIPEVFKQFL